MTDQQHRLHELHVEHAGEAHSESLRLQRTVRDRFASRDGKRGKRRKGDVIALDAPPVVRRRRSRLLTFFFWVEVVVAVIAVSVLGVYTYMQRDVLF